MAVTSNRRQRLRRLSLATVLFAFPVTLYYFSPFLSIAGATQRIVTGSIIVFGVQFLLSLFFGRLFCGWACPAGAAQEMVTQADHKRVTARIVPGLKWIVWGLWFGFLLYSFLAADGPLTVDFDWQTAGGISVVDLQGYIIYYAVLTLFVVLALTVGRRAGCHAVCWMAPFMILGRAVRNLFRWPALRLKAASSACVTCGSCTAACPMSLPVMELVEQHRLEDNNCILCGSCVDTCPKAVIRYSFSAGLDSESTVVSQDHERPELTPSSEMDRDRSASGL